MHVSLSLLWLTVAPICLLLCYALAAERDLRGHRAQPEEISLEMKSMTLACSFAGGGLTAATVLSLLLHESVWPQAVLSCVFLVSLLLLGRIRIQSAASSLNRVNN